MTGLCVTVVLAMVVTVGVTLYVNVNARPTQGGLGGWRARGSLLSGPLAEAGPGRYSPGGCRTGSTPILRR